MAEVAQLSETTAMTISRILSGRAPMRPEVARAIVKLAGPSQAERVISRIPARPEPKRKKAASQG